eukprot:CAMPEP_0117538654 /NCGR_PEP_ID=MMETSP0784-20121206/42589_1 /TAXON_ID=39447 /ORGANISM="" /LENGTH=143 /DNA_ID=CAMNT_0005335273 /DNA_START=301 /DNA_END=729 /DNA_ORIENTATION=-
MTWRKRSKSSEAVNALKIPKSQRHALPGSMEGGRRAEVGAQWTPARRNNRGNRLWRSPPPGRPRRAGGRTSDGTDGVALSIAAGKSRQGRPQQTRQRAAAESSGPPPGMVAPPVHGGMAPSRCWHGRRAAPPSRARASGRALT